MALAELHSWSSPYVEESIFVVSVTSKNEVLKLNYNKTLTKEKEKKNYIVNDLLYVSQRMGSTAMLYQSSCVDSRKQNLP